MAGKADYIIAAAPAMVLMNASPRFSLDLDRGLQQHRNSLPEPLPRARSLSGSGPRLAGSSRMRVRTRVRFAMRAGRQGANLQSGSRSL